LFFSAYVGREVVGTVSERVVRVNIPQCKGWEGRQLLLSVEQAGCTLLSSLKWGWGRLTGRRLPPPSSTCSAER
jgi:hypothetical protein